MLASPLRCSLNAPQPAELMTAAQWKEAAEKALNEGARAVGGARPAGRPVGINPTAYWAARRAQGVAK